jgi:CRP-like cAMP-binding protein
MQKIKYSNKIVTELPRGGYLVKTAAGNIQVGSPPETIKDTMSLPESVPQIFILPQKLFNFDKGISLAELEFPIYFNFFIKKRKITIIGSKEQGECLMKVLQEAVFGPKKVDITQDVHINKARIFVPDIKSEMDFYRTFEFKDLFHFLHFKASACSINNVQIEKTEDGEFIFRHGGKIIAHIPGTIEYKPRYDIGMRLKEPYRPPLFAVTCLGPSHGFDPTENTSGFIIWLNHRGIMVDPPVDSTEWLSDSNVNPKLIDSIILTHCHADHDAGTFQKILEESKVTVYTTKTVMSSFLRKYSALSAEPVSHLTKLFNFNPVYIDEPFFIHGAKFNVYYTLHSIPTIGFKMNFQGQSFVYSSDHQAEPRIHKELFKKGVINKQRYKQLTDFPWDSKVIYHEAGIPPLHTSIDWLVTMPAAIQKKTYIYHIAKKAFPKNTRLTLCKFGMEQTVYFNVPPPKFEKTYEVLSILKHLDFFHGFTIEKVQEFVLAIKEETYKKGRHIIKKGSKGEKFYIIYSGNVSIFLDGLKLKKRYGEFEYFGEVALITEKPTTADVIAETDVVVYTIDKFKFLSFIAGTEFEETLKRLVKNRDKESWNILSASRFFNRLTSYQKTWIESVLSREVKHGKGVLMKAGAVYSKMYIIRKGEVVVKYGDKDVAVLRKGDFIGNLHDVDKNLPSRYSFIHNNDVALFVIKRKDMLSFAERNPGLIMKLQVEY